MDPDVKKFSTCITAILTKQSAPLMHQSMIPFVNNTIKMYKRECGDEIKVNPLSYKEL